MRLKDETYEYIKQVVIDNFIYYKIRGIPINPFEIAITLGITIIPYSALSERAKELSLKQVLMVIQYQEMMVHMSFTITIIVVIMVE